ncbi:hypothetical protein DYB25_008222 [Aphanomyces astaci]|uniref:HCNGP-like protein n=1 Tax=Aphanomyces astaci TaxID=112090 RepID=A0A397B636_APHAT|nr:hypothetical protein AaE_003132 [Aphanomyces astaci]RHY15733.1 hypothetical protein DYB25_008222 [Aphanomyces astaci]RHY44357.1 hypothetical protein DYB30_011387 [Aphanomyces astaci]
MWNPLGVADYGSDSDSSESETGRQETVGPSNAVAINEVNEEAVAAPAPAAPDVVASVVLTHDIAADEPTNDIPALPALPDLPRARCDPAIQAKINKYLDHKERGLSFIGSLRSKKEFDNPYILARVVEYFGIEEVQSNFPKDVFDPYGYDLDDYSDKLAMALQKEQERVAMLVQQNPSLRWTQPSSLT